jgi:hypothetical protein
MRPFFKALLLATVIEVIVLLLTAMPVLRSFMAHSATDPNSASNNLFAQLGIYFHFPSFFILAPFGGILFAPLLQVLLITVILYLILRLRRKAKAT